MSTGKEYNLLLRKLDEFIRKYYKNQLLKGGILSTATLVLVYLFLTLLEYFGHFPPTVRFLLFYGFIGFSAFVVGRWVLLPLIHLFRLGRIIDHKEAARIIGSHFPEVKDKLLNTLELQEQAEKEKKSSGASEGLIRASIDQRIQELRPIPFTWAIDLSANRRYLKYALPPFLLLLILLFAAPSILRDGTQRIISHQDHFERQAPFDFVIENDSLEVIQKEDFRLDVEIEGEEVPDRAYIEMNGNRFRLKKEEQGEFYHEFKNVNRSVQFQLSAGGFDSRPYELKTLPDPALLEFRISAEPPSYTGMERIERTNSGDLRVPEGTKIEWKFRTRNTDELSIEMGDSSYTPEQRGEDRYRFIQRVYEDRNYSVNPRNRFVRGRQGIEHRIQVKKDRYPEIEVEERVDSLTEKKRFFRGRIEDDHGFSSLNFHFRPIHKGSSQKEAELKSEALGVPDDKTRDEFYHSWSLAELGIEAGDRVEYHFTVTDNDRINGPKSTRSRTMTYEAPTEEELRKEEERSEQEIKEELRKGVQKSKELKENMKEIRQDLVNKKQLSWKEKQKIEEAVEEQQELREQMERIQKKNQEMDQRRSQFDQQNEEIREKQKQLQELFDQVMSDEMKKMLEELQKKMDEMSKEELQEKMEEMERSNEEMEKRMDRNLEMFKQLEFEMELEESIERLKEMEKEQEKLSEESEQEGTDSDSIKERQDSLNREFQEARKELDSLRKKDEELERPNGLEDTEEQEEGVQKDMEQSSQELQKGQKKDASEKQRDASEKMGELSESLMSMQQEMDRKTIEMNMKNLRALLNNIIELSFDQEELMDRVKATDEEDPAYTELGREQKRIREDFGKVKDSLYELSKQAFQLKPAIDREVENAERNMRKSLDQLEQRKPGKAASRQQYSMTSLNELALLLDESLQNMQQRMAMKMKGEGNCQKPGGGGSPSLSQMRKMQQRLNEKMKEMQEAQQEGGKKGGKKGKKGNKGKQGQKGKNGKGGNGKDGMSKEIAKLAAEQEAIRRKLQELSQKIDPEGKGIGNQLQQIAEQMEESEKDMVEKEFDQEMMERQKKIETRLLKSEKAERERGYKKERKAEDVKDREYSNPEEFFEYKRRKEQEVELLKTVPPTLRPYYKEKVDRYFEHYQEQDR